MQNIGPILFLCSENDKLAPVETIQIYASNLCKLGGKVDLVVWKQSEHVGMLFWIHLNMTECASV